MSMAAAGEGAAGARSAVLAKPPLSCFMRTKNEERIIEPVLRAARQVSDDIVVVDSGSTDRTIEIAESLGARVIRAPWLGFGKQKRIGEEACKHDWLLDIDADEELTPDLIEEIKGLFANGEPRYSVYQLRLVTKPDTAPPLWHSAVVKRNRLYDRRVLRAPDHPEWDQFEVPAGMTIGKLKAPIMHRSWSDLTHLDAKFNQSSSSRAKNSKLKPFWYVSLRLLFARPFYFFQHYVSRGLWRAGLYGFAIASIAAHGRWLKDAKMLEMHLARRRAEREGQDPRI